MVPITMKSILSFIFKNEYIIDNKEDKEEDTIVILIPIFIMLKMILIPCWMVIYVKMINLL